ncbi:MAG: response regulator [Candidatus Omnitrophica bacterium]|nr:response regulator [Candidatus Omnitrophota bacterium]
MFNKTILVVENDPAEAEKILSFFKMFNFRNKIDIVASKGDALEYIFEIGKYKDRKNHETPGLIFLDLLTNKTKDLKLLKPLQVYLRTERIPIVILTSSAEQEKEAGEYGIEVLGFVRKPLDFTHFVEAIQRIGLKSVQDVKDQK